MQTCLECLPDQARVLVVRLRSIGDCVLSTPALHLLKAFRPDLRLAVIVEDAYSSIFAGNPDIERILAPSLWAAISWHPALCINMHGGTRSARLTVASRAGFRAGFAHFRYQAMYNVRIPTAQQILVVARTVHTAEHAASAMFYLGVPRAEVPRARLFARIARAGPAYAVLHPKASAPDKTWPADRFVTIARHVEEHLGLEPVFIAGSGESLREFAAFRCVRGRPLEEVKTLLAGASLFVGNDSGPAHMAAAFGVPVLVFYGSSAPQVWAPWRTESAVLAAPGGISAIAAQDAIDALDGLKLVRA